MGIADALITNLSNVRHVVVRPTIVVREFTAPNLDSAAVGRWLGAEAVLEGSVQREGERVRVTVQLVDTRDGRPLWARAFDEKFTGIFSVQDSISAQVADALSLKLSTEERRLLAKRYTENTEAYQS